MAITYSLVAVYLRSGVSRIISLAPSDVLIIALYFVMVLGIGIYLRRYANTSNDFFMAGREMTAWVAGLSFLSANLGAIELMGWAGSTYEYGILAAHFYWIAAFPSMVFLALVMMPFYYISKTHSVPGYLQLRYGEATRALSGISFAFMTVLMSGINMYAMALVMKVVLGWNIHFSIWVSSLTVAVYVALGGLYSAIFNEVLQFFLIWLGALVIPILGLIEVGGWSGLTAKIYERMHTNDYVHLWSTLGSFSSNPMGVHWTGVVFGLGGAIACGYWTTDFLVVQRAMAAKDLRSAQLAPIIASYFKMVVPLIVILPGLLGLAVLPYKLVPQSAAGPGMHSYNEVLPLMLARYAGPGLLGLGITALIAGFMSGMAGNVSAFATVWTYDIYQPYIKKGMSDEHYVKIGRWCTILGVILSIGTAYFVTSFKSIMDYMQALVGFFISPLFGTVVVGMLWKRATGKGGFWGLLAGTGSSVAMYTAVKIHPAWIRYVALSPDAKDMAENLYRALWSLLICVFVTIIVSLFTKKKSKEQLENLVWSYTKMPPSEPMPLWKKPVFWAVGVAIFFGVLQWMFW
ncbi:SSS sodium solute transporter superfamily [Candidatus Sulfotelmatomonas gaucii]|uniref:SSS sodium solute transporter superfamily n=1 Tax=Candidatus Sulfuritelmatomonas gaucii TaxID=2043161 RepID=A0A2N9M2E7_9BACT|nr:SSS sodium solute transporter superfamily [Candidatus Sulfotelmatomonas gaucii]